MSCPARNNSRPILNWFMMLYRPHPIVKKFSPPEPQANFARRSQQTPDRLYNREIKESIDDRFKTPAELSVR